MKKILLSAVAFGLIAASCKKKEDNNGGGGGGTTYGNFTVGTTTYTATTAAGGGSAAALIASTTSGGTGGSLTFIFPGSTLPTANGTYKVGSILPGPGEVTVSFQWANPIKSYYSTGNDNINATVTVAGGKITVDLPKIWAKSGTGGTDSVQISGKITQQ